MELYRVHRAIDRGGSSYGEWKYYEDDVELLKAELLEASLEIARERVRGPQNRMLRAWDRLVRQLNGNTDDIYPRISAVHKVEKLVHGEWQPVDVEFIPPEVRLK